MPPVSAILLGVLPLVVFGAAAWILKETPIRSHRAAHFSPKKPYPILLFAALIALSVALGLTHRSRADSLALALICSSLVGSLYIQHKLLAIFAHISRFYLDPREWKPADPPGPCWRYQMQHAFIRDPEYLDQLMLEMFLTHRTRADFLAALRSRSFPSGYEHLLSKRFWGNILFPSIETLATRIVPNELLENHGKYSPERTADQIYDELRGLALTDSARFLDRWQYYWCLRNLNIVDGLIGMVFSRWVQAGTIAFGAGLLALGCWVEPLKHHQPTLTLSAIAMGSLLWLLVACGSASLLIVGAFRGTGTFTISDPCQGEYFDPLWNRVIQVGIVAFAVSFVIYGLASPFMFEAKTLRSFGVDAHFVIYALVSLLFCGTIFVAHFVGIHRLMAKSRTNAMERSEEDIAAADATIRKSKVEHYLELRQLRSWPIRS